MHSSFKSKVEEQYQGIVDTPKACVHLTKLIKEKTNRNISSSTLRRFFGLLPSVSSLSKYNLDTLAIYCNYKSYSDFCDHDLEAPNVISPDDQNTLSKIEQITQFTLASIAKKSLSHFNNTIERSGINEKLNQFIESPYSICPVIAPGGSGKSIALAHWVQNLDTRSYIRCFCPATLLYNLLSLNGSKDLPLGIAPKILNRFIENFGSLAALSDKKIIMIIDALDEHATHSSKSSALFDYLLKILTHKNNKLFLKVIVACRDNTWKSIEQEHLTPINNLTNNPQETLLYPSIGNLLPLTNDEIRVLLEKYTNPEDKPIIYPCISWDLLELLRIPINIHFFTTLFRKHYQVETITKNKLYIEYIKELIFKSKEAEQKEDILWFLIDSMENLAMDHAVNKTELKNKFGVHLKREVAYYQAYKELLLDGILIEDRIENHYGIFTTTIKFKHQNFYFYLSALNLVRKNQGIDHALFLSIVQSQKPFEWIESITATLFEMAYSNEDYQAIARFCELPQIVLGSLQVIMAVGISFRINNSIRNQIIKNYAASPSGQVYFFEQFVDTNYLYNNYEFRIKEYLKNKHTNEAKLFGNSMLYFSSFMKMDRMGCKQYMQLMNEIVPDATIHPWPIGRSIANRILHSHFVETEYNSDIQTLIVEHQAIAYQYSKYLQKGLVEFELPVIMALALVNNFQIMHDILLNTIQAYNFENPLDGTTKLLTNNQNQLPILLLAYSKFKLNLTSAINLPAAIEKALNNYLSTFDDSYFIIVLNWLLCDYYLTEGNPGQAEKFWKTALELSQFANYDFLSAYLLINHPYKDLFFVKKGLKMVENTGWCTDRFKVT